MEIVFAFRLYIIAKFSIQMEEILLKAEGGTIRLSLRNQNGFIIRFEWESFKVYLLCNISSILHLALGYFHLHHKIWANFYAQIFSSIRIHRNLSVFQNYLHITNFQFDVILKFIADKLNYILKMAKDHGGQLKWYGLTQFCDDDNVTKHVWLFGVWMVCVRLHDKQEYFNI